MASRLPDVTSVRDLGARRGADPALGTVLPSPRYTQMVAQGRLPAVRRRRRGLVLAHLDRDGARLLRRAAAGAAYAWVDAGYADRVVDHVARMTYDHGYGGTGNWPFNTAYAARRTGHAFVTRLRTPARGRAVHRRRHPAGRLDRASAAASSTRRPDLLDQRPPAGHRRLHADRRRRRQRPGRPDQRRRAAHLRPRPVRGRLAQADPADRHARLRRARLRDPRRGPPAAGEVRANRNW